MSIETNLDQTAAACRRASLYPGRIASEEKERIRIGLLLLTLVENKKKRDVAEGKLYNVYRAYDAFGRILRDSVKNELPIVIDMTMEESLDWMDAILVQTEYVTYKKAVEEGIADLEALGFDRRYL